MRRHVVILHTDSVVVQWQTTDSVTVPSMGFKRFLHLRLSSVPLAFVHNCFGEKMSYVSQRGA